MPGGAEIQVFLTPKGRERFTSITTERVGKSIALLVDEQVISHPKIAEPISGDRFGISGGLDNRDEAERIAKGLVQ